MDETLHIILVEPEIPPNTGNIARLAACTGCTLHLVHPLGFEISDKQLRRAGLDYWHHLTVFEHADWESARLAIGRDRHWYALTTKATTPHWNVNFQAGDVLVFGPESRGLNQAIRDEISAITVPMKKDAALRSLNLASSCAVVVYEALRQLQQPK